MTPRRAVTLIEVLAAIFIMGIGLLALLTLFPLGALTMAKSVRDQNVADAGASAAGLVEALDMRNDPNVVAAFNPTLANTFLASDPNGPGYAVLIDQFAYENNGSVLPLTAMGAVSNVTPGLTRVGVTASTNTLSSARYFTFQDDLAFQDNGSALTPIDRPGRITWSYVLRRGASGSGALVEVSVLVYVGRVTDSINGETAYTWTPPNETGTSVPLITAGTTSLTLNYAAGVKPKIGRGSWLIDTSYDTYSDPFGNSYGWVHGHLYEVDSAEDQGNGTITVQLKTPFRVNFSSAFNKANSSANFVHLENVAYVLEKGSGWKP